MVGANWITYHHIYDLSIFTKGKISSILMSLCLCITKPSIMLCIDSNLNQFKFNNKASKFLNLWIDVIDL